MGDLDIPDVPEPVGGIPFNPPVEAPTPSVPDVNIPDVPEPTGGIPMRGGADINAPETTQDPSKSFGDLARGAAKDIKTGLEPFSDIAKAVAPFVGLGTAGIGMAGGIQASNNAAQQARLARTAQRMQADTLRSQQAAAAPLTAFGSQSLQDATAGKIPPAIQAQIDQWVQGALTKARDYAARSGQGNSTMLTQWEAWIQQQGAAMAADYLQKEQQLGVQSLQAGAQGLGGAAQNATALQAGANTNQGSIATLMEQANKALASLSAGAA